MKVRDSEREGEKYRWSDGTRMRKEVKQKTKEEGRNSQQ